MLSSASLKKTPLFSQHVLLKAKIVGFGGWEMPVQYEGIVQEYEQTRQKVSLFDTCHMGEFLIEGDARKCGLDRIVCGPILDMPSKTCRYSMSLNEAGGVIDDLIVYRLDNERWMIVVNGATTDKDEAHFQKNLSRDCRFQDISKETGKLDVQGPLSREVLKRFVPGIEALKYYEFDLFDVLGEKVIVSRTGYTGELGFEIYFPSKRMPELWNELLKVKDVKAAGLGARDVLRIEMCYSLYGQEIDETINPFEAGLEKFVADDKEFIGSKALLEQKKHGLKRKLIYFLSATRQSPRHHHRIFNSDKKEIGIVTSGTFSPHLKRGIGIGFVSIGADLKENTFFCGDDKSRIPVQLSSRPFYKNGSLKQ